MSKRWTKEEVDYLIKNYSTMTYRAIGQILNKSGDTVNVKARGLKLPYKDKKPDLIPGSRYGRLIVIEKKSNRSKNGGCVYLCKCDCGIIKDIPRSSLVTGNAASCGCLHKEAMRNALALPSGQASLNYILNRYKKTAKDRNLEFSLTEEIFFSIIKMNCHYCNKIPSFFNYYLNNDGSYRKCQEKWLSTKETVENSSVFVNGIDRVDNNKGYTTGNCVPCCKQCNTTKLDYTEEDFIVHAHKIVAHQESKKQK